MPRRSCWHMERVTSPWSSSLPTTRESALWLRCTTSAERLHAALEVRLAGELVEHLELADPEVVLPEGPFQRAGHPGVLLEQGVPVIDERHRERP